MRAYESDMILERILKLLAANPQTEIDLAHAALLLARDEYTDLVPEVYLERIDTYARSLSPRLRGSLEERTIELCQLLFVEEGFQGNSEDYYDPRNSYFNEVLDRKLGLPITLSILAMAVGNRAGLTVRGVALPGHFIAKACEGDEEILFDPFNSGQLLTHEACAMLVEGVTGMSIQLTPELLAAAPCGLILVRMLTNLKGIYLRESDFGRAVTVQRRLVQLLPNEPIQRRDLGLCLIHADRPGSAIQHLQAYLQAHPLAEDAESIRELIKLSLAKVAWMN